MEMSEKIDQIFPAIIAAQGSMQTVDKDAENKHFKSTYATLLGVREMSKGVLAANGLGLIILPTSSPGEMVPGINFLIMHTSGQWIKETCYVRLSKLGPQEVGSLHTYMRRYGEKGVFGIVDKEDDDDGNAASGISSKESPNENKRPATSAFTNTSPSQASQRPLPQPADGKRWESQYPRPTGAKGEDLISEGQQKAFYPIIKTAGWTENEAKELMRRMWGVNSKAAITRAQFWDFQDIVMNNRPEAAMSQLVERESKEVPSHITDVPPLDLNDIPF